MRVFRHQGLRGQTILELMGAIGVVVGLILGSYYLANLFEISQKQTMLLRTQAFINLGNYADYSHAKVGEDDAKSEKSHVIFELGEQPKAVRVDITKQKEFVESVKGSLTIDIASPLDEAPWWTNFRFPKNKTILQWTERSDQVAQTKTELQQFLAIAHHRKIDLDRDPSFGRSQTAGLFTGSLHWNQYFDAIRESKNLPQAKGLADNVDALKKLLKELVKNDPSLSEEATRLEKDLNAADSLSGGAIASLVSTAIQFAFEFGFEALGDVFSGGDLGGIFGGGSGLPNGGGFDLGQVLGVEDLFDIFSGNLPNMTTGQVLNGVSQGLNLANMGLSFSGNQFAGLNYAAGAFGAAGGFLGGFDAFSSGLATASSQAANLQQVISGLGGMAGSAMGVAGMAGANLGPAAGYLQGGFGLASGAAVPGLGMAGQALGMGSSLQNLAAGGDVLLGAGSLISGSSGLLGSVLAMNGKSASEAGLGVMTGAEISALGGITQAQIAAEAKDIQGLKAQGPVLENSATQMAAGIQMLTENGIQDAGRTIENSIRENATILAAAKSQLSKGLPDTGAATAGMTPAQKQMFDDALKVSIAASVDAIHSLQEGSMPSQEKISEGLRATRTAQNLLDQSSGVPLQGSEARKVYDQNLRQEAREWLTQMSLHTKELQAQNKAVAALVQAGESIPSDGVVVSSDDEADRLIASSRENAAKIEAYQQQYFPEVESAEAQRLIYAARQWRTLETKILKPRAALNKIRVSLKKNEDRFSGVKSVLSADARAQR